MDKKANNTTKKTITKKPGYIKQPKNEFSRWDSGSGVRAISDLKPIKRGK